MIYCPPGAMIQILTLRINGENLIIHYDCGGTTFSWSCWTDEGKGTVMNSQQKASIFREEQLEKYIILPKIISLPFCL